MEGTSQANESQPRLLIVAEGAIPTGFARVATSLFARLQRHFEICQLAPHFLPSDRPADVPPWPIASLPSPDEPQGEQRIQEAIASVRADIVWILADIQIVREYVRLLDPLRRRQGIVVVAYCPIDLTPLPQELVAPLACLDALVAYTEYGRAALEAALPLEARTDIASWLQAIPHGVDTATFFPIERAEARQTLLGEGHEDDFIVLNANRNQPRKRIDITVRAFARFARDKADNVRLHLHMGLRDRGWDIRELVRRYGLEERVIYTTDQAALPFVDDDALRLIYNAADVGVNTATTEGWGMVAFEHAATEAAQILPGHSVFAELWGDAAWLVPPRLSLNTPDGLFVEHYVGEEDIADALETLYADEGRRREMATAARLRATQPSYSWENIALRWKSLFDALLSRRSRRSSGMHP
jgi:glycosyltransferase involved in cell wall biosynthesis